MRELVQSEGTEVGYDYEELGNAPVKRRGHGPFDCLGARFDPMPLSVYGEHRFDSERDTGLPIVTSAASHGAS